MKRIICAVIVLCLSLAAGGPVFGFDARDSSDLLLLLNKSHSVTMDYAPESTVNIAAVTPAYKSDIYLREEAAQAYLNMYEQMNADGIYNMKALSGLRDYKYQTGLFNRQITRYSNRGDIYASAYEKASWSVAIPGTSEHQTGLALDVSTDGGTSLNFAKTRAGIWLKENSWKYGFILRYPSDKTQSTRINFEPWHYRYVGKPHAGYMYENNLCLEEYIELLQNVRHIAFKYENTMEYDVYYTTDTDVEFDNVIDLSNDNCGGYIITTLK